MEQCERGNQNNGFHLTNEIAQHEGGGVVVVVGGVGGGQTME